MSTPKRSKKKYIVIDLNNNNIDEFTSLESVRKHLEEVADIEGLDADDVEGRFEVYEVVRHVALSAEDKCSVEIEFD